MLRSLSLALALAASAASAAPTYSVVGSYKGADGGWDLLSVDSGSKRLYVAHGDAVTAVDLASGKVTDRLVGADRAHAALAIPGTREVLVTNGNSNNAAIVDGLT